MRPVVCVCVCVCVCSCGVLVRVFVSVSVCVSMCEYVCVYVCVHVFACIFVCAFVKQIRLLASPLSDEGYLFVSPACSASVACMRFTFFPCNFFSPLKCI